MCKQLVKPQRPNLNAPPRHCKRKEWKDGWCWHHSPERLAERARKEREEESRRAQWREDRIVGRRLRERIPEMHKALLTRNEALYHRVFTDLIERPPIDPEDLGRMLVGSSLSMGEKAQK